MDEKEKKAVEILEKEHTKDYCYRNIDVKLSVDILLNLIEKQQKEIKELKWNNDRKSKFDNETFANTIKRDYISKDKIKAKINWLESQFDEGIKSEQNQFIIDCVAILEELLEE